MAAEVHEKSRRTCSADISVYSIDIESLWPTVCDGLGSEIVPYRRCLILLVASELPLLGVCGTKRAPGDELDNRSTSGLHRAKCVGSAGRNLDEPTRIG